MEETCNNLTWLQLRSRSRRFGENPTARPQTNANFIANLWLGSRPNVRVTTNIFWHLVTTIVSLDRVSSPDDTIVKIDSTVSVALDVIWYKGSGHNYILDKKRKEKKSVFEIYEKFNCTRSEHKERLYIVEPYTKVP